MRGEGILQSGRHFPTQALSCSGFTVQSQLHFHRTRDLFCKKLDHQQLLQQQLQQQQQQVSLEILTIDGAAVAFLLKMYKLKGLCSSIQYGFENKKVIIC